MKHVCGSFALVMLLVSAVSSGRAEAQAPPGPPAGTVAAEMQELQRGARGYGGLIDVTAVTTTLIAFDQQGRPVLDLLPDELMVLEDNEEVRLLDLEAGAASQEAAPPVAEDDETAVESAPGAATVTTPWRVVIYVSTELAGRFVLPTLCRRTAGNAERLTALGGVDVVLADPSPVLVMEAGRRPEALHSTLIQLAESASGATTVEQIRNQFTREFKPGVGFDRSYTITQQSPQTVATKARAAIHRERTVVRGELDRMVAWMQSQPPTARGLLVWMTGGFDLNPSDYYIPLVEQIDHYMAQKMRTDYEALGLQDDLKRVVEMALSYGWTIMPVNATRSTFTYGAEQDGTGKSQHYMGVGAATLDAQGGDFRQVAPNFPLQVMARATGGEFVANDAQFAHALDRVAGAYFLTYQADRPADGRLHRLEIRCTRPGVRLRGRQYAASGSLRGVAATRGQRILAGEELSGGLEISAEILNISRADKGLRLGDLRVSAQIGGLRAALRPLDLGQVRVTVVVDVDNGPPFVNHQEFKIQWDEVLDSWQYGAGFRWPKKAHRAAVLVEELVTSTWGAAIVELD